MPRFYVSQPGKGPVRVARHYLLQCKTVSDHPDNQERKKSQRMRGFYLLSAMLLFQSGPASAAGTKCVGQWHLDLSPPEPAAEAWLPEGSWCRAKTLPKVIAVSVHPKEDGLVSTSGTPYSPTDVLNAGGRCEFRFEGKASGLSENNDLDVDVDDAGPTVRGTAKCSEYDSRKPDGTRSGTSIAIAVSGTRSAATVATAQAATGHEQVLATVVSACRKHQPDDLWAVMTARFRAELEQRASDLRRAMPAADLRQLYGYRGQPQNFSGQDYLRHVVKSTQALDNPCANAEQWRVGKSSPVAGGTLVLVHQPQGVAFGLKFAQDKPVWRLDQITKLVSKPAE